MGELSKDVLDVLRQSQQLGFLGKRSIPEVVDHARAFVGALTSVRGRVLDMGAGGGVPGLVIAHDRPDLDVVLVDRRGKRTDYLDRMVGRLNWTERVTVVTADLDHLKRTDHDDVDAVVARGFGPPDRTLRIAAALVADNGLVVISEPPSGDRWRSELLAELGARRVVHGDPRVVVHRIGGRRAT